MSKPFTDYSYDDAANLVGSKVNLPRDGTRDYPLPAILESFASISPRRPATRRTQTALDATELYFGNHWLDSRGFIGQLPPRGLPGYASMISDIRKGFVADNVIKEVVKTHVGGILGREPGWSLVPIEDDDASDEELKEAQKKFSKETGNTLTRWWNDRKALKDLQKAVRILVCEGIVVRRIFFPRGRLADGKKISAITLQEALNFIYFETVYADQGGVFTDPETMRDIGIFLFDEFDANGDVKTHCAELSFLNDAGDTVCKIVRDEGAPTEYQPYPLGGYLLIYEMTRDALITEQIQSNQRALNLAHTQMIRNVNLAGNRETNIANAQPPLPKTDKTTITSDTARTADGRFPGTFKKGVGAVNFLMGVPIHDEDGNIKGYTNPTVNISDPVSVETFDKTIDKEKEAIYAQAHQRHVLIVDKADTSGRAREVARREYERSLKESKTEIDACGRWQIGTTTRLAAFFIGESSRYLPLRPDFNTLIDAGAPDPEQQQMALQMRQPGGMKNRPLISDETARELSGIEDNAAEEARIDKESTLPEAKLPENPQAVPGQQTPKPVSNAVN